MTTKTYHIRADEDYPIREFTDNPNWGEEVQLDEALVKKYLRAQKAYNKAWYELNKALIGKHTVAR